MGLAISTSCPCYKCQPDWSGGPFRRLCSAGLQEAKYGNGHGSSQFCSCFTQELLHVSPNALDDVEEDPIARISSY
jgi:hypothetical protein